MTAGEKVIKNLPSNLSRYRKTVDQIFSPDLSNPTDWQRYFFDVLLCTSQLYLDYLLLQKAESQLGAISRKTKHRTRGTDTKRESLLRRLYRERLESSTHWTHFIPENPFSDSTGLRTNEDYINEFALHLPEIYEETFRVEGLARDFLTDHSTNLLAQMLVGMEHLARHHVSFVQQALQWAADDISWNTSSHR
jgi:hypothetical protein